ncbi:IolE Sugar phosphate isomerases/epimerases [Candidatus Nanopelagicaceae bacterium]
MKYSISNLSWGNTPLDKVIPKLSIAGLQGVEIAPTAIWSDLNRLRDQEIIQFKKYLKKNNLVVSGIQSLLYGQPELQLFDQSRWGDLRRHLENMIRIGGLLGADVAVFGSPKNRQKGGLDLNRANDLANAFLIQLIPCLKENNVVLTLEPNAPEYGADYLTTYEDVINLCRSLNTENIQPQIDTGCLWMVGSSPENGYKLRKPHHIHLSVPKLKSVPGTYNFDALMQEVNNTSYANWLVIEMLATEGNPLSQVLQAISWLTNYDKKLANV